MSTGPAWSIPASSTNLFHHHDTSSSSCSNTMHLIPIMSFIFPSRESNIIHVLHTLFVRRSSAHFLMDYLSFCYWHNTNTYTLKRLPAGVVMRVDWIEQEEKQGSSLRGHFLLLFNDLNKRRRHLDLGGRGKVMRSDHIEDTSEG